MFDACLSQASLLQKAYFDKTSVQLSRLEALIRQRNQLLVSNKKLTQRVLVLQARVVNIQQPQITNDRPRQFQDQLAMVKRQLELVEQQKARLEKQARTARAVEQQLEQKLLNCRRQLQISVSRAQKSRESLARQLQAFKQEHSSCSENIQSLKNKVRDLQTQSQLRLHELENSGARQARLQQRINNCEKESQEREVTLQAQVNSQKKIVVQLRERMSKCKDQQYRFQQYQRSRARQRQAQQSIGQQISRLSQELLALT